MPAFTKQILSHDEDDSSSQLKLEEAFASSTKTEDNTKVRCYFVYVLVYIDATDGQWCSKILSL